MKNNYYIQKDEISGQTVLIEFDKLKGYNVLPKTKKENEIEVNKIVFINPSLSEKIIKRKINIKMKQLLKILQDIEDSDDEDGTENTIRKSLVDAQRLKLKLINSYIKFLGSEYRGLTLEKLEIIIKEFRTKLYLMKEKNNILELELEKYFRQPPVEEERRGRGR